MFEIIAAIYLKLKSLSDFIFNHISNVLVPIIVCLYKYKIHLVKIKLKLIIED